MSPAGNRTRAAMSAAFALVVGLTLLVFTGGSAPSAGVRAAGVRTADAPAVNAPAAASSCRAVAMTVPAKEVVTGRVGVPGNLGDWTVRARLCVPSGARTVELLLSGATYGSEYWDFAYDPARYSYVRRATAAGRATLNVDRVGVGASTHPAPELLTTATHARIVHLLVHRLRTGAFGQRFRRVVLVGHSYGSVLAATEAATYHDVNGLVLTSFSHRYSPGLATRLAPSVIPATLLGGRFQGLPPGYLTTRPGTRSQFYWRPNASPAVIAHDEATKQTLTDSEAATFPIEALADTVRITAPVLIVIGAHDYMLCGLPTRCGNPLSLIGTERAHFPRARAYRLTIIPNAGHALNLHRNAPTTFRTINRWLTTQHL